MQLKFAEPLENEIFFSIVLVLVAPWDCIPKNNVDWEFWSTFSYPDTNLSWVLPHHYILW